MHTAHVRVSVWSLHLTDGDQLAAIRFKRLHDRLEFKITTGLVRVPQLRINAIRDVDCTKAERPRFGLSRKRRGQRFEKRQRHHSSKRTAQERSARKVLLRNVHCY